MRRIFYPILTMLLGVLVSTLLAFALASAWRSFDRLWLIPLAFLPSMGVALGCWLAHRLSGGRAPWPITSWFDRTLLVLLGAVGSVAASYFVYIAISSAWFGGSFTEMVFTPSTIQTFSESSRFGQHERSIVLNLVIGLLVGSYGTFHLIRAELFPD